MIQHETRNKERLQEKIHQADKKEKDTYDQGVKRLGFDPIKHFPDVVEGRGARPTLPHTIAGSSQEHRIVESQLEGGLRSIF